MIDLTFMLKWIHILSSTVLFGTGLGIAFFMCAAHFSKNVAAIAHVSRIVVLADWIFTLTSGIIQPISGVALAKSEGIDLNAPWLQKAYALYFIALVCWLPVVWLQLQMRNLANEALEKVVPLHTNYYRYFKIWFCLGWPAFLSLLAIFYMMISKPY
jgi:uncharacterized membrane protein